jgi:hypothetical protein
MIATLLRKFPDFSGQVNQDKVRDCRIDATYCSMVGSLYNPKAGYTINAARIGWWIVEHPPTWEALAHIAECEVGGGTPKAGSA